MPIYYIKKQLTDNKPKLGRIYIKIGRNEKMPELSKGWEVITWELGESEQWGTLEKPDYQLSAEDIKIIKKYGKRPAEWRQPATDY